ncbi:MAG: glutamate-5-semialdehyde dehydrogenase [Pseudomonadota bacterium]|nr:glutamate-5-semialdehyde dehydrogenase [Pseudomonadota bacterium]MEC7961290.1 glutamate-5-semialdehyde dehydrogenase [Pseudomonadota bacterium]MEC8497494.1 glutamate-5-semialdehyde dehydrogenase [Pseudomonadota bacterium]GIS05713.1 MAG: gamma-glutamyl phosphate reductase [Candidatus Dadabacteria bacterium]|tara:strand:+ start:1045 stop:2310 length:1266 start_codon:yes stop_codon:yes gene_type:complete
MSKELEKELILMGKNARKASQILTLANSDLKNSALEAMAVDIEENKENILEANIKDVEKAKANNISKSFLDRLILNDERIKSISDGLREIIKIEDPIGQTMSKWDRPNGLNIERVRTPLGVIGVIYESRPNVTADAGALCLKAGNAVILRGGSESYFSSNAIYNSLKNGLIKTGLPEHSIQIIPTTDRSAVGYLLSGLNDSIDVVVPRGGKSLVERVQNEAKVPVFGHLEGICHVYIDKDADVKKAIEVTVNAKMRRTGICGAAETLLIDKENADIFLPKLAEALEDLDCELRGCNNSLKIINDMIPAEENDWSTEYLDAIISIKIVDGIRGAIDHINSFSTSHTDSIITENIKTADIFLKEIDSAIVMHNASTQFADGGEFGMGAEIGIATGRFHARGPVGVEQLTSFKYVVRGSGQIRP